MEDHLNLARILAPQKRKDILRRGRLVDQLHQNINRKLNFISTSAGFGKTSLMLDFANELDVVCWYQIARGDEDLVQFARYLTAAIRQKFKAFGQGLENLWNVPGETVNPQSLATAVINEIVERVDDFCVLFLDDFHLVGESRPIADFIETFLDYLPDQLRIVMASRSVYGIPTAKLFIRNQIATISVDDLRFHPEEITELVRLNFKKTLPSEQAEELAKRSDGWIVAILLSMQSLSQGKNLFMEGFTAEQVYTFLAQDVIERESKALQDFMLATSIQDEFSAPFVGEVLEMTPHATQTLLQELERRNLFITRIETTEGVAYRYHQLFLDFLRDRLLKADPERKLHLHRRAAEWHRTRAAWPLAVAHQLATGNRTEAAAWMDTAARDFYVTGQTQILAQWVEAITSPPDLSLTAPRLMLNWAKVLSGRTEYDESERLLTLVEPILDVQGDEDQIINLKIQHGHNLYAQSRFDEAYDLVEKLHVSLAKNDQSRAINRLRRAQAHLLLGNCLAAKGDFIRSVENLKEAVQGFQALYNILENDSLQIHVLHDWGMALNALGAACYEGGNMVEAQFYLQEALNVRKMNKSNQLMLAESLNNLGYLHFQIGAYREAWNLYQEAVEILKPFSPGRIHVHLHGSLGDLLCALEALKEAEEAYWQAVHFVQDLQGERVLFAVYCGLAQIATVRLQFHTAFKWLRDAAQVRKLTEKSPLYQEKLGEIYLAMGHLALSRQAFELALWRWENMDRPRLEKILAVFFLGNVLFLQDEFDLALEKFQVALEWAAHLGVDEFLVLAGRKATAFLEFAAFRLPDHAQLQSLWARVQAFQPGLAQLFAPTLTENMSTMHLEISAFGLGMVRRNGKSIAKAVWQSSKTRALFFYFVERRQVSASDIKLDFWPEFNASRATTNLQTTLWRARNALDSKEIILNQEDAYALAGGIDLWYDIAEFRNYLKQAANPSITPFERAECWRRAVDLYQGDYLSDITLEWAEAIRRELLEKYLDALLNLARWETSQRRYPQAIQYYEKAIEKEPFEDAFHLAVMECWVHAGSIPSAKAHFVQYQKKLEKEGLIPLKPLLEYYASLFANKRRSTPRKK